MDSVYDVIEVIGLSAESWEDAARVAVDEASQTLRHPLVAEVLKQEVVMPDGAEMYYRVTLAVGAEIDLREPLDDVADQGKRFLIVANQTLASPGLEHLVHELVAATPSEFHVVVPQASTATLHADPSGLVDPTIHSAASQAYLVARQEAENRLRTFRQLFDETAEARLTGEIAVGDPLHAVRRAMDRRRYDEIIVSTLPPGISKWLKLDLPHRIERAFDVPVISLIQEHELLPS